MRRFELATAGRILFGIGSSLEAPALARERGSRALVVTGRSPERAGPLRAELETAGLAVLVEPIAGEPTTDAVRAALARAREAACDVVIGFGGGGALDAGKALAALLANGGDPLDYLEVVGRGRPLRVPSVPFLAIPTTAGTGSEVTRNAVLASPEHRVKASLRSPMMLPAVALVDPDLLRGVPRDVAAATGMDALTQLVEPFVSRRANPVTDALCHEGIARSARFLERAVADGEDAEARENVALASLLGGLALANAGLGAVHGLAAAIGGAFPAPHGALCARLLPEVARANLAALRAREPESPNLPRFEELARLLTGRSAASAEEGLAWLEALRERLAIPPLREWGLADEDVPALVEGASRASSTKGNPVTLTPDELGDVLLRAL